MNFSLIIPTRERINELDRLVNSIIETAYDLNLVEFIFICDNDYQPTIDKVKQIQSAFLINSKLLIRERSEFVNRDYYNFGASQSSGEFIWACADDLVFLHRGWDKLIYEKLSAYLNSINDKIVCAVIKHNTHFVNEEARKIPSFPLISRETFNILGFLLHPQIPTWGADILLSDLYDNINRLYIIDEVCFLDHISHHTTKIPADGITRRYGEICAKYAVKDEHNMHFIRKNIIPEQVKNLIAYINNMR